MGSQYVPPHLRSQAVASPPRRYDYNEPPWHTTTHNSTTSRPTVTAPYADCCVASPVDNWKCPVIYGDAYYFPPGPHNHQAWWRQRAWDVMEDILPNPEPHPNGEDDPVALAESRLRLSISHHFHSLLTATASTSTVFAMACATVCERLCTRIRDRRHRKSSKPSTRPYFLAQCALNDAMDWCHDRPSNKYSRRRGLTPEGLRFVGETMNAATLALDTLQPPPRTRPPPPVNMVSTRPFWQQHRSNNSAATTIQRWHRRGHIARSRQAQLIQCHAANTIQCWIRWGNINRSLGVQLARRIATKTICFWVRRALIHQKCTRRREQRQRVREFSERAASYTATRLAEQREASREHILASTQQLPPPPPPQSTHESWEAHQQLRRDLATQRHNELMKMMGRHVRSTHPHVLPPTLHPTTATPELPSNSGSVVPPPATTASPTINAERVVPPATTELPNSGRVVTTTHEPSNTPPTHRMPLLLDGIFIKNFYLPSTNPPSPSWQRALRLPKPPRRRRHRKHRLSLSERGQDNRSEKALMLAPLHNNVGNAAT